MTRLSSSMLILAAACICPCTYPCSPLGQHCCFGVGRRSEQGLLHILLLSWSRLRALRGGGIQPWEHGKVPPDYYAALGLTKKASEKEIRKAHKKLVLKHHPDKNVGAAPSSDRFLKIQEAYTVLTDSSLRQEYDNFMQQRVKPTPGSRTSASSRTSPGGVPPRMPPRPPQSSWAKQRQGEARWERGHDASWRFRRDEQRREEQINKAAEEAREALLRRHQQGGAGGQGQGPQAKDPLSKSQLKKTFFDVDDRVKAMLKEDLQGEGRAYYDDSEEEKRPVKDDVREEEKLAVNKLSSFQNALHQTLRGEYEEAAQQGDAKKAAELRRQEESETRRELSGVLLPRIVPKIDFPRSIMITWHSGSVQKATLRGVLEDKFGSIETVYLVATSCVLVFEDEESAQLLMKEVYSESDSDRVKLTSIEKALGIRGARPMWMDATTSPKGPKHGKSWSATVTAEKERRQREEEKEMQMKEERERKELEELRKSFEAGPSNLEDFGSRTKLASRKDMDQVGDVDDLHGYTVQRQAFMEQDSDDSDGFEDSSNEPFGMKVRKGAKSSADVGKSKKTSVDTRGLGGGERTWQGPDAESGGNLRRDKGYPVGGGNGMPAWWNDRQRRGNHDREVREGGFGAMGGRKGGKNKKGASEERMSEDEGWGPVGPDGGSQGDSRGQNGVHEFDGTPTASAGSENADEIGQMSEDGRMGKSATVGVSLDDAVSRKLQNATPAEILAAQGPDSLMDVWVKEYVRIMGNVSGAKSSTGTTEQP